MNKRYFFSLFIIWSLLSIPVLSKDNSIKGPGAASNNLFVIDRIETVIYGPEETSIITKSDIGRPGLDGTLRTKEKVTFELLVFQDAKKYRIIDDEMVDRYIAAVQSEHNITLEDLKNMFKDAGYTYVQGREQLSMLHTVNSMLDFKIRSKLIIPENDVRAYYEANPLYSPEAYQLQRIFVGFEKRSADLKTNIDVANVAVIESQKKEVMKEANLGQKIVGAEYSEAFLVTKDDLAEDKQFICQMESGDISEPLELDDGFEMFKLVARQERALVPFEVRRKAIADKLRMPMYEKLLEEYKAALDAGSVVVQLR